MGGAVASTGALAMRHVRPILGRQGRTRLLWRGAIHCRGSAMAIKILGVFLIPGMYRAIGKPSATLPFPLYCFFLTRTGHDLPFRPLLNSSPKDPILGLSPKQFVADQEPEAKVNLGVGRVQRRQRQTAAARTASRPRLSARNAGQSAHAARLPADRWPRGLRQAQCSDLVFGADSAEIVAEQSRRHGTEPGRHRRPQDRHRFPQDASIPSAEVC